jgi:hypothetical protein
MLDRYGPGSGVPFPEAAHRARRIRGSLRAMDSSDAGVLQCGYKLRAWPVVLWDECGRLPGWSYSSAPTSMPESRSPVRELTLVSVFELERKVPTLWEGIKAAYATGGEGP